MNVQKFVYETLRKIQTEAIEKESWKSLSKPASKMTEMEIDELQRDYVRLVHKVGQISEFLYTWILFTDEE